MSTLINNATIKVRRDTSSSWTTNNPTPNQGEWCLETDTGNMKIGDGSTAWTSLAYYIPASLANTYDLTSENKTHTLPEITGAPQIVSIYWTNGGTYKLRIKDADNNYLDYEGEGEGHILVESDGSNWQVREYEDTEDWHEVGASGEPAFQNGWANMGGDHSTTAFKFYKNTEGNFTIFKGLLDSSASTDSLVFTLPKAIYKPNTYSYLTIAGNPVGSTQLPYLRVDADGSVHIKNARTNSGDWQSLHSIKVNLDN